MISLASDSDRARLLWLQVILISEKRPGKRDGVSFYRDSVLGLKGGRIKGKSRGWRFSEATVEAQSGRDRRLLHTEKAVLTPEVAPRLGELVGNNQPQECRERPSVVGRARPHSFKVSAALTRGRPDGDGTSRV